MSAHGRQDAMLEEVKKERDSLKGLGRYRSRLPVLIVILGIMAAALIVATNKLRTDQNRNYVTMGAMMDIEIEISIFHLWFEEYISGDKTVDMEEVWSRLDHSKLLVNSLLGGALTEHGLLVKPLDGVEREKMVAIQGLLVELGALARERLAAPKGEHAGVGTELDERFDTIFKAILSEAKSFERHLNARNIDANTEAAWLLRVMLASWVAAVIISVVVIVRTGRKERVLEERLRVLATHDSLTGAYNRARFDVLVHEEMERARRFEHPLSLIMLDLDHFKEVNDTYGHQTGDYVLRKSAEIVRDHMRKSNRFVRWGGEEFMIISIETDMEGARALAERIRRAMEHYPFHRAGMVTASFGVAELSEADTRRTFVKRVDEALYLAKDRGRNRVEILPSSKSIKLVKG